MNEQINLVEPRKSGFSLRGGLSFGLVVFLAFLLPIFFVPAQTFSFFMSKSFLIALFVFLLTIAWLIERIKNRDFSLSKNLIIISALLVPFSYLISSLFSGSLRASIFGYGFGIDSFGMIFTLFLLMFFTARVFLIKKKIIYFYLGLLFSGVLIFFFHVLRLIFGPDFLTLGILNTSTANFIGSWNEIGIFFGLISIISLLTIIFLKKNTMVKVVSYLALIFSLFFVALVNFGSLWLALALISLTLFIYHLSINKGHEEKVFQRKNVSVISLVIFVISLVFLFAKGPIGGFLPTTFNISNFEVRPSTVSTIDIIQASLPGNPILGAGPAEFSKQWSLSKPIEVNNTQFWDIDFGSGASFLLTSLVTVGLLGCLSWIFFFVMTFYSGIKLLKISRRSQFDHFLSLSAFFATVYLWFFSIVYVPGLVTFALSFLFTGVLLSLLYQERVVKLRKFSWSRSTGKSIVLIAVMICFFFSSSLGFYLFTKKANASIKAQKSLLVLETEGDIGKSLELMGSAVSSFSDDLYYRLLVDLNLIQLQAIFNQEDVPEDQLREQFQTVFTEAITNAEKTVSIGSDNYQNWMTLAKVYGSVVPLQVEGSYDKALEAYGQAITLSSNNPAIALALANLEIVNDNEEKGKEYALTAIQLKNNYSDAYYLLSQIEIDNGNEEGSVEIIEALAEVTPNDPKVHLQLGFFKYSDKNYEEAVTFFEEALRLDPYDVDVVYLLGLTYNELGDKEKAIQAFTHLQRVIPEDQNIAVILENLQSNRDPLFGLEQTQ
ncbi:MAG: tetratricopeptide repeat protein [Patescibacteria group bacterium]|nr:tetratricopeptide repeat protein [Patescibacteria group bacterium]